MLDLSPSDLDFPSKFSSFRPKQAEAIDFAVASDKRFIACSLPTGEGKSGVAIATALLENKRTVYLTATKGLEDQVFQDFRTCGAWDIRGRANYSCKSTKSDCNHGFDHGCPYSQSPRCPYSLAVDKAKSSSIVVTNYAYWLHARRQAANALETEENPVELLICDEAHSADEQLSSFLRVVIDELELPGIRLHGDHGLVDIVIQDQASALCGVVKRELQALCGKYPTLREAKEDPAYKHLSDLITKLDAISKMDSNWVWQLDDNNKVTFDCIHPAQYANYLWSGVPKILLLSATLRPYTLSLLGLRKEDYDYKEWPSSFPPNRGPVYYVPTVRLNYKSSDEDYNRAIERVDEILASRRDRKGIIQTVSYGRASRVLGRSRFRSDMVFNESGSGAARAVLQFKRSGPGTVLVSPSFSTGYDFPGTDAEFQIIIKIPFPDTTSRVMAERCKDQDYQFYLTIQELVQMAGRARRYAEDRSECVAPSTKILTADLRWVEAGSLREGDRLLAFDEIPGTRKNPRRWRWSNVVKARTWNMPRVRVVYEDGEMVCTPNHPWMAVHSSWKMFQWVPASSLKKGKRLFRFLDPWSTSASWNEGWLAGFFDGEGCLVVSQGKRNPNVCGLYCVQNEGRALSQAISLLGASGFDLYIHNRPATGKCIRVKGGYEEILRFLGQIRPVRLLENFLLGRRGERLQARAYPKVLAVEPMSKGPITSLQTTTATYIAEGMGAHNTFILDNNLPFVLARGKKFAPSWFKVHTLREVPKPPPKL